MTRNRPSSRPDLRGEPQHDVPFVNEVVDCYKHLEDPQAVSNDYFIEQQIPTYGERRLVGNVVRFNGEPGPAKAPPPALGAHNEEILSSLGYSPVEIDELTMAAERALRSRLDA